MKKTLLTALVAATLLSAGCQTYQGPAVRTRQTEDRLLEQESQRRMAGRLETLELEISRISRELDGLRRGLETRCAAIERKSEDDKRELVSRLSTQIEKLLAKAAPPAAARPTFGGGGGGGNVSGFEHVVRKGETISTIAKAYNCTPKAIIDANNIKNPGLIRIGQTLFIPE